MLHEAEYELLDQSFLQMIQSGDCNVDLISKIYFIILSYIY